MSSYMYTGSSGPNTRHSLQLRREQHYQPRLCSNFFYLFKNKLDSSRPNNNSMRRFLQFFSGSKAWIWAVSVADCGKTPLFDEYLRQASNNSSLPALTCMCHKQNAVVFQAMTLSQVVLMVLDMWIIWLKCVSMGFQCSCWKALYCIAAGRSQYVYI